MPERGQRPSSREEFRRELIGLVSHGLASRRRTSVAAPHLDGGTPLFESGLIDSMAILDLIAFVEHATGRAIPVRRIRISQFATIDRICDAFWREDEEVAHAGA